MRKPLGVIAATMTAAMTAMKITTKMAILMMITMPVHLSFIHLASKQVPFLSIAVNYH